MAFSMSLLALGIVEYGMEMQKGDQLGYAMEALKWGTDYFIKAHTEPFVMWGEVSAMLLIVM